MNVSKLQKVRAIEARKILKKVDTLDMGGADGWLISQALNPERVTVIDLNKDALEKNPCKNKIYGNFIKNNLENESFNQVSLFEVIEHIKEKEDRIKVFSEANRLLKKGGRFVISTPNYERLSTQLRKVLGKRRKYPYPVAGGKGVAHTDWHYFEYSEELIRKDLEKAGFSKIKTHCRFIQIPYFRIF